MSKSGFTLAELLIALAILGVIATFTIPKVLNTSQSGEWNATAKEAASMISGAYQAYQLDNTVTASFSGADLLPYINYVSRQTTGSIDNTYGNNNVSCTVSNACYVLHNGGKLRIRNVLRLDGTTALNAINFTFDPDGVYSGSTTGPGKSVDFWLYYNGRITDTGGITDGTLNNSGGSPYSPAPSSVPPWFSW